MELEKLQLHTRYCQIFFIARNSLMLMKLPEAFPPLIQKLLQSKQED